MNQKILCRETHTNMLSTLINSNQAEFLAVYGRRRVGKTFLIRSFCEDQDALFFHFSGMKDTPLPHQLENFTKRISEVFIGPHAKLETPKTWRNAFRMLHDYIATQKPGTKIIIFLDEFPWMATRNSRLLQTLDYFWNQYWCQNSQIKCIICGSASGWILKNIVNNKGGLHNRLTKTLLLEPFSLGQTKIFLKHRKVRLNNNQITALYMALGGIPYYLNQLEPGLSAQENIDKIAFQKNSFLLNEFDNLYSSLFDNAEFYIKAIREIAKHPEGVGQEQLLKTLGSTANGGTAIKKLDELISSGFIIKLKSHFNLKKGIYYRLIDEYTYFYLKWIEPVKNTLLSRTIKTGYWSQIQESGEWHTWAGYAFEALCYKHLNQISDALHMNPTAIPNSWRHTPSKNSNDKGTQIDILFDRRDDAISICEIKYTQKPFIINKEVLANFRHKVDTFKNITKTKKQLFFVLISANGLKQNMYADDFVDQLVTLNDLFGE